MPPRRLLLLAALATTISASAQSALLNKNILPEGSFDIFGESRLNPSGWTFPDRNDKPWAAGYRAEAVKGESGTRELRIIHPDPSPDMEARYRTHATLVGARLPVPPKLERLRISYRLLPKSITLGETDPAGNGAGIYYRFYDAEAKAIRGAAGWVGGSTARHSDSEWQDREQIVNVPAEAKHLELHVLFRGAGGEVFFDDVEVVPLVVSE